MLKRRKVGAGAFARRLCGSLLLLLALATSPAASAQTLDGEVLSQHTPYFGPISGVCSTDPASGATSYSMDFTGRANGPYPGTFTERIQATIGPQTAGPQPMGPFPDGFDPGAQNPSQFVPAGQLLSLTASFAIESARGSVTGTKRLTGVVPTDSNHAGVCREWANEPTQFGTVTGAYRDVRAFDITYEATITTSAGSFRDEGSADLQARQGEASNQGGLLFDVNDIGQRFDSLTPQPALGRSVAASVVRGRVFVAVRSRRGSVRASQKGVSFVPLDQARTIPVGSFIDTRRGTVRLTSARDRAGRTQSGNFTAGVFKVLQSRRRTARGLTQLVLTGGSFSRCRRATASQRRLIRRLRGNARGRFRSRGRHSAATVRGTVWSMSDRCDGTLTKVRRGRVAVRDFRRKRTVLVRAGRSYLARARR